MGKYILSVTIFNKLRCILSAWGELNWVTEAELLMSYFRKSEDFNKKRAYCTMWTLFKGSLKNIGYHLWISLFISQSVLFEHLTWYTLKRAGLV